MDIDHEESNLQKPTLFKRLLGYLVIGIFIFAGSFWLFQQPYQKELETIQAGNLTDVRIMSMTTSTARSGEITYELVIAERFDSTFRVSTSLNTYQQLTVGQQTALYFNESLNYVLLDKEMSQLGIIVWVALLLLFTVLVISILYGVGYVYKRFRKRGRPERPLSELSQ